MIVMIYMIVYPSVTLVGFSARALQLATNESSEAAINLSFYDKILVRRAEEHLSFGFREILQMFDLQ